MLTSAVQVEMTKLLGASAPEVKNHFMDNFGVVAQQYAENRIWLFDYDQLAAHKHRTTPVVMESRGLMLCASSLAIVRRPFNRFFNIGEAPAYEQDIDYGRLQALEKVDGSLITLYYNQITEHWHFGTRGTPFADNGHALGGTFASRIASAAHISQAAPGTVLFDQAVDSVLSRGITYLFEYIGPENHHITPYKHNELVLLGARHHDGLEFTPEQVDLLANLMCNRHWNVRRPKVYNIPVELRQLSREKQVAAMKAWVAEATEFKGLHEGVVCQDKVSGKRLKIKTPLYCAVHLQGGDGSKLSLSRVIELVANGDADEFCIYNATLAPLVRKAQDQLEAYLTKLEPLWAQVKDIQDQKAFALALGQSVPSAGQGLFFYARKNNSTPRIEWASLPLSRKASLLEKFVKL